jgi:Dolichyl-phosphate-mannose-protein mannosyltransferase
VGFDLVGITVPIWLPGLVSNGLLLLGSFWIARHGLRQARGLATALGTGVVYWTACTLGLEILSPFGGISAGPMLAWSVMWLALGGLAGWLRGGGSDRSGVGKGSEAGFSTDSLVGLGLLISAALILGMRSLLLAVKVVSDGPIYHLYFAARWWKAGRLFLVAAPFGENAATYFPANGDLWFTWLMASWGGDRLAKVGQAPFLLLATVAAFGCARVLGATRPASLIAACWFASSTPFLLYSFEPNVDTIFVAGYMMAAYFFLRALRGDDGTGALCLGALAAGGALGTKAVGVVFIPPLLALATVLILFRRRALRTTAVQCLVVLLVPLVTGGYWYFCNALLTGNPLYPLEVRVLGRTLLPGWYGPDAMHMSQYYIPLADWRALADILLAVLDPRLVPLWAVAVVAGWANQNSKAAGTRGWAAAFGLLAILNVVLYWMFIPYRSQQRFMLQALGLAVVPLALLLDRWRALRLLAAILLGMHLLTPECWPFVGPDASVPWDLSPLVPNAVGAPIPLFARLGLDGVLRDHRNDRAFVSATLGAILVASILVSWAWCRILPGRGRLVRRAAIALTLTVVFAGLGYMDVWLEPLAERFVWYPPFADFYLGWQRLEAGSGPKGSRVAYAGTNIPYYLFGKELRNHVQYVNIDGHREWLLHDYHRQAMREGAGTWPNARPGWDRGDPDFTAWLANLDAEEIQLLVVTRVNPAEGSHNVADREGFPIERLWAESHPERFEVLYGRMENDPWFRLYRVRRPGRR